MTNRKHNFSAGPCTLPLEVLEEAQAEFVDYQGAGMSLFEMSHRGSHFVDGCRRSHGPCNESISSA